MPARRSRLASADRCASSANQPGVDPLNLQNYLKILSGAPGLASVPLPNVNLVGLEAVPSEPKLRCYVYAAGC